MQTEKDDHKKLEEFMLENQRLLAENNELLKKIHRNAAVTLWIRIIWVVFIIGLPFVIYFYVVQPYFDALGSSFSTFQAGLQEIPGWKQFWEALKGSGVIGRE